MRYQIGGTATNGADYASLSGAVTIPAGAASATVVVAPVNDPDCEGPETVDLTVQADAAYTVGSASAASVTIADNDRPIVTIVATDASATETGDTGMFTITRTGPTTASLRVTYSSSGSAIGGVDYPALGSQIFIPPGSSTVTLTVTPTADGLVEGNENVDVTLIANSGVTIGSPATARVVILANSN